MSHTTPRSLLDDPGAFAEDLYGTMGAAEDPRIYTHAPREYADFKATYRALCAALDALGAPIPCDHPVHLMDERAHAWAGEAFFDGVRFGLAADHLRRSLVAMHDVALCSACFGNGRRRGIRCEQCEGNGFASLVEDAA